MPTLNFVAGSSQSHKALDLSSVGFVAGPKSISLIEPIALPPLQRENCRLCASDSRSVADFQFIYSWDVESRVLENARQRRLQKEQRAKEQERRKQEREERERAAEQVTDSFCCIIEC